MIEREQVVFPLRVNDIENDPPLQPAHHRFTKHLFLLGVAFLDPRHKRLRQLVVTHLGCIDSGCLHVEAKLIQHFGGELGDVPFFRVLIPRAESVGEFARDVFGDAECVVLLFFSFERGAANRIDSLALLIHHVVILEQVLASLEVLRLHSFLSVFDPA